MFDENTFIKL